MKRAVAAAALALATGAALADIYTCTDGRGRRITSDRPIAECLDREQTLRNSDGSVRRIIPPSLSAEEKAAQDELRRQRQLADAARKDLVRNDRNLLGRFPNEASHQTARAAALEPILLALKNAEKRTLDLQRERRKLDDEAEFYKGRALPRALQVRRDDNQASHEAQITSTRSHAAELARINALYDEELSRLRRLWAGAPLGSLGPVTSTSSDTQPAR